MTSQQPSVQDTCTGGYIRVEFFEFCMCLVVHGDTCRVAVEPRAVRTCVLCWVRQLGENPSDYWHGRRLRACGSFTLQRWRAAPVADELLSPVVWQLAATHRGPESATYFRFELSRQCGQPAPSSDPRPRRASCAAGLEKSEHWCLTLSVLIASRPAKAVSTGATIMTDV